MFEDIIEEKLLNLHTAFIGKIIQMEGPDKCSVQPLDKIKAYGQPAKPHGVISKVPILNHVRRYTLKKEDLKLKIVDTYTGGGSGEVIKNPHPQPGQKNIGHLLVEPLKAGDIVLCVCTERDLGASSKGISTVPPVGHHGIKDAVVVGWLGKWPHES